MFWVLLADRCSVWRESGGVLSWLGSVKALTPSMNGRMLGQIDMQGCDRHMADEGGMDDMGDDDMGGDDMGSMKMDKDLEDSFVREYVEKVSSPKHGDNGANAKSIVAGKNDMGGTTANIVKGGESTTGGTKGGLANPGTKEDNAGNVNVPGGKAGVKHLKKQATPKGGDDGDKSAGSPLNGAPGRAK